MALQIRSSSLSQNARILVHILTLKGELYPAKFDTCIFKQLFDSANNYEDTKANVGCFLWENKFILHPVNIDTGLLMSEYKAANLNVHFYNTDLAVSS